MSLNLDQINLDYAKINKKQIKVFILLLCSNMLINANFAFNKIVILPSSEYCA